MRTYTTYAVEVRSNERLGWLAPARQLAVVKIPLQNFHGFQSPLCQFQCHLHIAE